VGRCVSGCYTVLRTVVVLSKVGNKIPGRYAKALRPHSGLTLGSKILQFLVLGRAVHEVFPLAGGRDAIRLLNQSNLRSTIFDMPGFTDSFWSAEYGGGLGVLFEKLYQGVVENQQMLTIATLRAEAEEMYSEKLGDIAPTIDRMTGGFTRDDGASVRKVNPR
jgi:hypothetical protein